MSNYRYRPGSFTDSVVAAMKFEERLAHLAACGREKADDKKAKTMRRVTTEKSV